MRRNGFGVSKNPILKTLDKIECRDALLNPDGIRSGVAMTDSIWATHRSLATRNDRLDGRKYVERLRAIFAGSVAGSADFVMYWFHKAAERIQNGKSQRAGFVATQSIRRGSSSEILQRIVAAARIFDAWEDEEWTVDGAAVRVSLVCFTSKTDRWTTNQRVNDAPAREISRTAGGHSKVRSKWGRSTFPVFKPDNGSRCRSTPMGGPTSMWSARSSTEWTLRADPRTRGSWTLEIRRWKAPAFMRLRSNMP